jgi:hypothetical protein
MMHDVRAAAKASAFDSSTLLDTRAERIADVIVDALDAVACMVLGAVVGGLAGCVLRPEKPYPMWHGVPGIAVTFSVIGESLRQNGYNGSGLMCADHLISTRNE